MSLHSRSARHTSTPSPSGSTRSRIAASGRCSVATCSASAAVSAGNASKPASRMHDLQRAHDVRLVVADEHPRPALMAAAARPRHSRPARRLERAARRRSWCPGPGSDSAHTCAAVGLDEALDDRQAEPRARVTGQLRRTAVERLEDPGEVLVRDAGPAIDDPDHQLLPDHARPHRDPLGAGVAHRVLEQVRERTLELGLVRPDERQVPVDGERHARPAGSSPLAASCRISSIEHHCRRGSAAPA